MRDVGEYLVARRATLVLILYEFLHQNQQDSHIHRRPI